MIRLRWSVLHKIQTSTRQMIFFILRRTQKIGTENDPSKENRGHRTSHFFKRHVEAARAIAVQQNNCHLSLVGKTLLSAQSLTAKLVVVVPLRSVSLSPYYIGCVQRETIEFYTIPKLFSHFDWFSPTIYQRTDRRLTSSPQSFPFCILKWRKVFRNKIIFYVTG